MFAAPMAAISLLPLTVSPLRAAKVRESTAVSVKATSAMPAAGRASAATSAHSSPPSAGAGRPCGRAPTTGSRSASPRMAVSAVAADDCDEHARDRRSGPGEPDDDDEGCHAEHQGERLDLARDDARADGDHVAPQRAGVDREPEQLRHLGDEHQERDGVEVAHPDRLREQVGHEPQAKDAAEQQDRAHHDREESGERHRPRIVSEGERQDRRRDDRCERRVGPEHQDARRAEERVRQERHDGGVQARLGRQPGDLRVAHARRDEQRGDDEARPQVGQEPRTPVVHRRLDARRHPTPHPLRRHLGPLGVHHRARLPADAGRWPGPHAWPLVLRASIPPVRVRLRPAYDEA